MEESREPMYMYTWKGSILFSPVLVYSEESKDNIQKQMANDNVDDQYDWYEVKKINYGE